MAPRILIVDADSGAARATAAVVRHIVPEATILVQAKLAAFWSQYRTEPPDLLIIDPALPGSTELLLIRLFKQEYPQMRVIVVASRSIPALRKDMQALNVDMYLEKPGPVPLLIQYVRAAIQQHNAEPQLAPITE